MTDISSKRVLFVSHRTTRTGAPIVLLQILQWLHEHSDLQGDLLIRKGGELERELTAAARECYHWLPDQHVARTEEGTGSPPDPHHQKEVLGRLQANRYRLIYANSIICCPMLPVLWDALRVPVIVHVHELESLIELACGHHRLQEVLPLIARFIAVSEMVKSNLIDNHGIPARRIETIPAFVKKSAPAARDPKRIRQELGIPPSAFIVGGSGTLGLRKGTDLFLAVARRVADLSRQPIHFVWLGGTGGERERIELRLDVRKCDLEGTVHFVKSQPRPRDYFNAFDLFLLTSREDPFPLVCLENARLGNPILCFDKASGCLEYVDESCGHVSPYMDVDDMAAAVIEFADDPVRRRAAGAILRKRVASYSIDNCAPRIVSMIRRTMEMSPPWL